MKVDILNQCDQLAELSAEWERLPRPSPMQSPAWILNWWDAYREPRRELAVLAVKDDNGQLLGLALWYTELSRSGRCLRWLGDGATCSDHATLLCQPLRDSDVVEAIADWLLTADAQQWRKMHLEAVDEDDCLVQHLVARLANAGQPVSLLDEAGSCFVNLPDSWEQFLTTVSKNHRKRCRRWERDFFATGRATTTVADDAAECRAAWQDFVALHNERRHSLGQIGAFRDERFRLFHESLISRLAQAGQLQIRVLRCDGEPVAAEYVLRSQSSVYAYQSGLSARGVELSAGSLSVMSLIRDAITTGRKQLDLLRGDEPYKFSWAAQRRAARTVIIRRGSATGHVGAWCDAAWRNVKRMKRRLTEPV